MTDKIIPPVAAVEYMKANKASPFIASLYDQYLKYGRLSEKQVAAVNKSLAPKPQFAVGENISKIDAAFKSALSKGLKRPKLLLGDFKFKPAKPTGVNPGAIYVTQEETYLGKIIDGVFSPAYACTGKQASDIVAVCSNPLEAAVAFGKLTGACSCCGRALTDKKSVELGIGPVCAAKYGFI